MLGWYILHPDRKATMLAVIAALLALHTAQPHATPAAPAASWEQLMLPPAAEDDPWFDCRVHGDAVCGPGNAQGVAPGLYAAGQLVADWEPAWYGRPDLVPGR